MNAILENMDVVRQACRRALASWPHPLLEAEDAAQETLLSLLEAGTRREIPASPAYAVAAARHHAVDLIRSVTRADRRRVWRDEQPDAPTTASGPAEAADALDARGLAWQLLLTEQPEIRRLLWLRVACGLSAADTAELLGSTPGAVRLAQHRALRRLRCAGGGSR